jgi:hypothetical protein
MSRLHRTTGIVGRGGGVGDACIRVDSEAYEPVQLAGYILSYRGVFGSHGAARGGGGMRGRFVLSCTRCYDQLENGLEFGMRSGSGVDERLSGRGNNVAKGLRISLIR